MPQVMLSQPKTESGVEAELQAFMQTLSSSIYALGETARNMARNWEHPEQPIVAQKELKLPDSLKPRLPDLVNYARDLGASLALDGENLRVTITIPPRVAAVEADRPFLHPGDAIPLKDYFKENEEQTLMAVAHAATEILHGSQQSSFFYAAMEAVKMVHEGRLHPDEAVLVVEQGGKFVLEQNEPSERARVSMSQENYEKIRDEVLDKAGITSKDFMTGKFLQSEEKKELFLKKLATVIRSKAKPVEAAKSVSLPDEVMAGAEKNAKVEADCVTYALITQQFLKMTGKFDAAILNISAINKHGEEIDGHMTATVEVEGYLVDPAVLQGITRLWKPKVGRANPTYEEKHDEILKIYHDAGFLKGAEKLEFSVEKEDNELNSVYHLESARKPASRLANYDALMFQAYEENPKNAVAAVKVGNIYKLRGEIDKACEAYSTAAKYNPNSYLANVDAGMGVYNLYAGNERAYAEDALALLGKANAIIPNMGNAVYNYCNAAKYLGKSAQIKTMVKAVYPLLPEDSPYREELAKMENVTNFVETP